MASWFYLYLYTDTPKKNITTIDARIRKETHIMSDRAMLQQNIEIDEGTSHWIDCTVKNDDGTDMDLEGCTAVFTSGSIEKACLIDSTSHINVKLEPEETTGFLSRGYQIRVFDENGDVFQIIQGIIYIRKAHKPYIQNPLKEGER